MPKRIQRRRTKGWRMPTNTVCVTRPGKFGNPFETAEAFQRWIEHGKNLACYCPLDQPCHADVLLELANRPIGKVTK